MARGGKGALEYVALPSYFGSTLDIDDGMVRVTTGQIELSYLFEATLADLVSLGGKSSVHEINPLAFQKWGEVKSKYQNHKIIDWDGTWPDEGEETKK